jgi:2-polyprenyl-3-methyl-5-hydroxy-6-metoxy-1,4-benzoquinol methylase
LIKLIDPLHILDVGCGEGFDIQHLSSRIRMDSLRYCGLDLSLGALENAKVMLCKLPFAAVNGNIYHLPFALNRFDAVLCLEVLEHLKYPELALERISSSFQGACVFSVPNEPLYRLTRLIVYRRNLAQLGDHPDHLNHWSKRTFVRLLERYFVIERVVNPFPWTIVLCRSKGVR